MAAQHGVRFPLGPRTSRLLGWFAVGSALLPVPFLFGPPLRLLIALAVATAASVALALGHRACTRPHGWVVAHGWGVVRDVGGRPQTLLRFAEPFGVTVLASQACGQAVLALTTPTQTRFLGVRLAGPSVPRLLEQASLVADGDMLAAHARAEDSLSTEAALTLLRLLRDRAPLAPRRLFLSGTRGERVVLDGANLRVDRLLFDLSAPLEWRGFVFHETLGPAASVYQATWVRQGGAEVVFVAPLVPSTDASSHPEAPRRRVLTNQADEPPPRELRMGIERVFMLPVREALARSPRFARPSPKRTSSPDLGV